MSHTPTTLAILRGSARFSRITLLVILGAGVLPLAFGVAHLALGTEGAAGFVAGAARSFVDFAAVFVVGWVVTGWFLESAKRESARLADRASPLSRR